MTEKPKYVTKDELDDRSIEIINHILQGTDRLINQTNKDIDLVKQQIDALEKQVK